MNEKLKSYWSRPEGKTGMIILAGIGVGLIYLWGKIVPFLLAMVANTIYLALGVAALVVLLMVIFSPRTHLLFRLLTRAITGMIINIDPIGILKDRAAQLMKKLQNFQEQMTELRKGIRTLDDNIEKNKADVSKQKATATRAKEMGDRGGTEEERLRGQTQYRVSINEVNRLEAANKKYLQLKSILERLHKTFTKLSLYMEGYVADAQNEARSQEIQRKTLKAGTSVVSKAMGILKGNATENDIYNTTLEKLADDASANLGMIDEGLRFAEDFMAKVDLTSGGIPEDALASLETFEQKLLPPAVMSTPLPAGSNLADKEPAVVDASYTELFSKKG